MTALRAIVCLVALQRLAELVLAAVNTRHLRARGATEFDAGGYPWLVVLHGAWLASVLGLHPTVWAATWPLLGGFAMLQLGRLWVIATLGRRWTTRIIVPTDGGLIAGGPYRLLRHPNYAIVVGEIALLPLALGMPIVALAFSAANLTLLRRRIAIEERALGVNGAGRRRSWG